MFIDIAEMDFGDGVFLLHWEASFELDTETYPNILDLLTDIVTDTKSPEERKPLIEQVWELIKKIPDIPMQYLPAYELKEGEFSGTLRRFYRNVERSITRNPAHYIKENIPYCEGSETIVYRLTSAELCKKFWRWVKDGTIVPVSKETFQGELSTPVARYYVNHYNSDNQFYIMSFDFPVIGWLDCWFILRGCQIPFFFFKKSPLLNLFSLL
jgi:hypothetical protein